MQRILGENSSFASDQDDKELVILSNRRRILATE